MILVVVAKIGLLAWVLIGLIAIPFGLPGLGIMAVGAVLYEFILVGQQFSAISLGVVTALAILSELFDYWLTMRLTKKAGASRQGGWGALIGGIVGAIIGVPIPIIGSVIGSLVGLFLGAYVAQRLSSSHQKAAQIGWAALVSRMVSTAIKFGIGAGVLVWVIIMIF